MYALANTEVLNHIGDFIDRYVQLIDGSPIPRNTQMYQDAFVEMLRSGEFHSIEEIKRACLIEEYQMIPDYLFKRAYDLIEERKKCQANTLDSPQ